MKSPIPLDRIGRTEDGRIRLVVGDRTLYLSERFARALAARLVVASDRRVEAVTGVVGQIAGAVAKLDDLLGESR